MINASIIEEAIDVIRGADNASGYCTCGRRVVAHRSGDHRPIDDGEQRAENVLIRLEKALKELQA